MKGGKKVSKILLGLIGVSYILGILFAIITSISKGVGVSDFFINILNAIMVVSIIFAIVVGTMLYNHILKLPFAMFALLITVVILINALSSAFVGKLPSGIEDLVLTIIITIPAALYVVRLVLNIKAVDEICDR